MYTAPDDYIGIQNRSLTFSTPLPPMSIPVTILDDLLDEEDIERFTASLTLVTDNPRVQIDPSLAEVLIEDDDGMCEQIVVMSSDLYSIM